MPRKIHTLILTPEGQAAAAAHARDGTVPNRKKRLTTKTIENLKGGAVRREIPDPQARGLYVIVQPSGRRSFAVRGRFEGRSFKLTLPAGTSLANARKAAGDAESEVAAGRNPAETVKAQKAEKRQAAADTFQKIADEYVKREGAKLRTMGQRESLLRRLIFPEIGNRPIDSLKRVEIVRLLDKIEDQVGATTADMAKAVLGRIFNWHAGRSEFRSPIVRGMGQRRDPEAAKRERTLTDDEIRAIWTATSVNEPFNNYVRFLLLTSARRKEAARMRWDEIDANANWTLPKSRNKTKKYDLVRPLSRAAQAVLARIPRVDDCPFVFSISGKRPFSSYFTYKQTLDQASGTSGWILHDLRRTARSLMSRARISTERGEEKRIDPDIAERCLGHVVGSLVERTYDQWAYRDEKLEAFEALAALIDGIVHPPPALVASRA
jgi:integrase